MKKQDILILAALIALFVAWPWIDRAVVKKFFPNRPLPAQLAAGTNTISATNAVGALAKATAITAPPAVPVVVEPPLPTKPEQTLTLKNDVLEVVVSSKGAALSSVVIKSYRESVNPKSGSVKLDFAGRRALAPVQLAGVPTEADFDLRPTNDGRGAELEYRTANGLLFHRIITLPAGKSYLLDVADTLKNGNTATLALPAYGLQLGPMRDLPGETQQSGYVCLGVDALPGGGEKVQYLAGSLAGLFDAKQNPQSLALPITAESAWPKISTPNWLAVKNKYFAQILMPNDATESPRLYAQRALLPDETLTNLHAEKMTSVTEVSATMMFPEARVEADKPLTRNMQFYVGPKLYAALVPLKRSIVDVMEFGFWGPVGKVLLGTMNVIHDWLWPHNYGLAIMLLTILIRVIFWPLTHKGTQSMKRMQAVQPLMKEIREKYKDNAQKQQQEMMKLYKEHKINPLGGCLPMVIQIPVFIALFVVLRSAIELRFAGFLWIKDLSEAENLFPFGFSIPLLGWSAINILPILMAVTMFWQQKLTPSTGDPQQQKIMMIMPVMMLFFFYNFAAGLSLYWTTNQILMIVQLYWQRKHPTALAKA
ncbi:MAG: membrane protein insertase YidC [Verrucomicrobia bacterium]|nr:MAG: membrane protein insertase YidC [Verrucomicrobiota bacterium]